MRRRGLACAGVLTVAAQLTLLAPAAEAYKSGAPICGVNQQSVVSYSFDENDPMWNVRPAGWTESARAAAVRGFSKWNDGRNRDGTVTARATPAVISGARQIQVILSDDPDGEGAAGQFRCDTNQLVMDSDFIAGYSAEQARWVVLAAHEMGHALGMHHTGMYDSHYGGGLPKGNDSMPLMATCVAGSPVASGSANYSNDDAAGATYYHGIGANATLTANYGFEEGMDWFWPAGASPTLATGSTSGGFWHAQVAPNSSSDNLVQTISFSVSNGRQIRPSLQYMTPGAVLGSIRVQLYYRVVDYAPWPNPSQPSCGYPINKQMNDRVEDDPDAGWLLVQNPNPFPLSNVWRVGIPTYTWTIPTTLYNEPIAVDVRLRIYSSAASSTGGYVHVHYDDVRIQEG